MDNTTPTLPERGSGVRNENGSTGRSSSAASPYPGAGGGVRPSSLMDATQSPAHVVQVVVNRDDKGYGMKVSGDNPVYVQSVKDGGAAERAGLHAGDKIIKVNGVNVTHSTHTQVVALIRSSCQVVLTVQQRSSRNMGSPSLHNRPLTTPTRITSPQPVDNEKQHQLQLEKEQYYRLMIEKEQNYVDLLRSQLAACPDEKKFSELAKTEKNLQTLQAMLRRSQNEQSLSDKIPSILSPLSPILTSSTSFNGNSDPPPPPLPKRNQPRNINPSYINGKHPALDNSLFLQNEINANVAQVAVVPNRKPPPPRLQLVVDDPDKPPPLPPRNSQSAPVDPDAVNSINKQMSYPLVATCATLVNNYSPNPTHHRTKSSPESLLVLSGSEASRNLIASESMQDLNRPEGWDGSSVTPPGTPPPPYPSPLANRRDRNSNHTDEAEGAVDEHFVDGSSPDNSPFRTGPTRLLANSSPIHAASPQTAQQRIISMEDDEMSDQELSQLEDHGHFKSLSRLWEHLPHLAVFTNYILSNTDPNSLLFYLLTDLYKEGNAKEMRKWAFEIHSCFLVPDAPLWLSNVDENIAREIDDVLTKEYDKEEILRKIFWKARSRAKEELTKHLADFQQKRTAGLGTIFGPPDHVLQEVYSDKTKEGRLYENLFSDKWEGYLEDVEKEHDDWKKYYTAAALTTVFTRVFSLKPSNLNLDRCPTFVSKEKFKNKFIGRYLRKLNIQGHQYVAQQYFTVIACNHCHRIIFGIGPQGYQCTACLINLHRTCVKLYEDICPGPITKKDRGITKFIRMTNDHRRKQSSHFIHMEKEKRHMEESNSSFDLNESGKFTFYLFLSI